MMVESPLLGAGEVDFIFPQAFAGITDALAADNIEFVPGYGTNYEGLYFQQGAERGGPFSDPVFREAFSKSIDRDTDPGQHLRPDLPRLSAAPVWALGADRSVLV